MKFLTLLLLFSFCWSYSFSQEFNREIGIGTGYYFEGIKNDLISPFAHTGSVMPFQLFFRSGGTRDKHHLQYGSASPTLHSSSGSLTTEDQNQYLQYAYHRNFSNTLSGYHFYAGGVFETAYSNFDNHPSNNFPGNNQIEQSTTSLSPSLLTEKKIGNGILSMQLWVALVAFLYESGYANSYPSVGTWASFGKFTKVNARLSYSRSLGERWLVRIDGQFQYLSNRENESVASYYTQAVISIGYKFHKHEN